MTRFLQLAVLSIILAIAGRRTARGQARVDVTVLLALCILLALVIIIVLVTVK